MEKFHYQQNIMRSGSGADNTQLMKGISFESFFTSANRPSVKYLRSDDFPTVLSPMRMSLEVEISRGNVVSDRNDLLCKIQAHLN